MITQVRKFAKSPWAIGLFALLVLGLLVTGGSQADVLGSLGPRHVIDAGDRSTDAVEFRSYAERVRSNVSQQSGQPITFEEMAQEGFLQQMLESRTQELGFLAWAWKVGIRPGGALIVDQVRDIPSFFNQVTGQFDQQAYETALAQQNLTVADFEQSLRDEIAVSHYAAAVFAGIRAPSIYGAVAAASAMETRDGSWFQVTQAMAGTADAPSDAQLTAFLNENAAQLRRPEVRTVSAVLFTPGPDEQPTVSEAQIQERYEFRREALATPEQRTFVTIPAASEAAAQRISQALRGGQTVQAVAEANNVQSTNYPGRARSQVPDQAVAEAAFALQEGQVSDPIRTQVGYVVARVERILPGTTPTLETVREEIVGELQSEAARGVVYEKVEAYEAAINEGADLAAAAERAGARIVQLPPFTAEGQTASGQPLPAPPQLISTSFSLPENGESDVIDAGEGQYFALRVDEIQPAALPALEDVRAPLTQAWTARENSRRLNAFAERLATRIRGGEDIAAVAASVNAQLTSRDNVNSRQETQEELGAGVMRGLFGQGKGQIFVQPQAEGVQVIGRVDEIRAANPQEAAPLVAQIRPRVTQQTVQEMIQSAANAGMARVGAEYDLTRAREALGLTAQAAAPTAPSPAPAE